MRVFVLQHESASEDVKLVGIYGSEASAEAAKQRASRLPGFSEEPEGFSIDGYELDRDGWTEGFVTEARRSEGRAA